MGFCRLLVLAASLLAVTACSDGGKDPDARPIAEGDRAPGFTLPSASGRAVQLSDFAGRKPALLYFSMGPG